jgi:FkbM family methyltransferase
MFEYNTEIALEEFKKHGEYQMMQKLSDAGFNTIFDVGCNQGEWTRMVRSFHTEANIHMFEIAADTYRKMLCNITLDEKIVPNNFGLSSVLGEHNIKYVPNNDRVTTTVRDIHHEGSVWKHAIVLPGDMYAKMHNIGYIDFLKIDTEGHELFVLEGVKNLLTQGHVAMLQFEYGYINILTKNLLIDFYKMLSPLGYHIGKLTPDGVLFKEYHLLDEDFKGPDYVAVHNSRPDLINFIKK